MAEYGVVFYGTDPSPLTVGANDVAEQGSGSPTWGANITSSASGRRGFYPQAHTPGGFNCGWDQSTFTGSEALTVRTRSTSGDVRTCGKHGANAAGDIVDYVFGLSPGTYDLRIAAGDRNYATYSKIEIFDNTTSLGVLFNGSTVAAGRFWDANGTLHTSSANWVANNVRKRITISTGPLRIRVGDGTNGGGISYASIEAVATGTTIAVGQATETDSAFSIGRVKTRSVGMATEADSAFSIARKKTRTIGLAVETDSALSVAGHGTVQVGLATEIDTAFSITRKKTRGAGQATETDSALALTAKKTRAIGLASESDSALAITRRKSRSAGMAAETDTAFAVTRKKLRSIGLALESDQALALVPEGLITALGLATEIDTAMPIAVWKVRRATARTGGTVTGGGSSTGTAAARSGGSTATARAPGTAATPR